MKCKCKSERILSVSGKCSDIGSVSIGSQKKEGYVPYDMGIGGGDYIEFNVCLDCGQMQGTWPLPITKLENKIVKAKKKETSIKAGITQYNDYLKSLDEYLKESRCLDIAGAFAHLVGEDENHVRIAAGINHLLFSENNFGMGTSLFWKLKDWDKWNELRELVLIKTHDDEDEDEEDE
jgi:hypothetical protein